MNVRRRSGNMDHPIGGVVKNAVTQRKDSPTSPKPIKNQVSQSKDACYTPVANARTQRKG